MLVLLTVYLLRTFLKTFVTVIKKNPACLSDLVNSGQPENTGKKTTSSMQKRKVNLTSSKEVPINFSKKPKEATNPSNEEASSVSLDDKSAELPKSSTQSGFRVVT